MNKGRGNTLVENAIPPITQEEVNTLGFQKEEMATIPVDPPIPVQLDEKIGIPHKTGLVTVYEQYPSWIRIGILFQGVDKPLFFYPYEFNYITPIKETIQ